MTFNNQSIGNSPLSTFTAASDTIGGVQYQRVKLVTGTENSSTAIDESNPLPTTSGAGLPLWDYMSLATGATTETYTFKLGGSGGTTVATLTVTYTDSTKETISTVERT